MLAVIALATLIEDTIEVEVMIAKGTVMLADLLLLFFYLEIFAMVGVYFCSGQLPGGGMLLIRCGPVRYPYGELPQGADVREPPSAR